MWLHVLRHESRSVFSVSIDSGLLHSICLRVWVGSGIEFEYLRLSCQGRDSAKANTTLACPMGRVWQARSTSAASVINMSIMHTSPTTKHTYSQRCLGDLFHQFENNLVQRFNYTLIAITKV